MTFDYGVGIGATATMRGAGEEGLTVTTSESLSHHRPDAMRRRVGYSVSIVVNSVLLVAILGVPGWDVLPFLTDDFRQVLGWVVAGLIAGVVANAIYVVADPPAIKALGDLVIDALGLVALIRLWQVFPFDFGDSTFPWSTIVRVVLVVGMAGTAVAMIVLIVQTVLRRR